VRNVLVGTAAAVVVLSGGVASAADDPVPGGDDGWAPVPEEYWAPIDVEVCGSTVTITGGDVREAEQRSEVLDDGSTFTEYRGAATVDITRVSDGAAIDELDISGYTWDLVSADGTEVLVELDGPSLIWAGNEVERAAADEAGLPYLFWFEEGTVLLRLEIDPETGESVAADTLRNDVADEDEVDLCEVLDEAADDEGGGNSSDDVGHGERDD
jgi:hypothetical protein